MRLACVRDRDRIRRRGHSRTEPEVASPDDATVEVFRNDLDRWERCEERLRAGGVSVPLEHRACWLSQVADGDHWFAVDRSRAGGRVRAGVPLALSATRSLPGHAYLRGTKLGYQVEPEALEPIFAAVAGLVRRRSELLGAEVEVFDPDAGRRERLGGAAQRAGFEGAAGTRSYRRTVIVDLGPPVEEIRASFSETCRRFIRDPEKKGCTVEPILEDRMVRRMKELWGETFSRTGAAPPRRDWARRVAFARRHPRLYRIVGTFGPGHPEPGSLLAFCCAMNNGDHAVYSDGASTRDLPGTVALTYAPMWDLVRWARSEGCRWFDMGGISQGTHGDDADPRGGISDFKRRFGGELVEVGAGWRYRSPSIRGWLADTVRRSASAVHRAVERLGGGSG